MALIYTKVIMKQFVYFVKALANYVRLKTNAFHAKILIFFTLKLINA